MSFQEMGLAPEILRALKTKNYEVPTPIQTQAIPVIMEGADVIGCAQTGTGKTAGFTLPILHQLREKGRSASPRVLVLVPTRELAAQVHESIKTYGRYMTIRTAVVYGGVGIIPQKEALRRGVDIVVATPGRLLDHLRQGTVNLKSIEVLVIDEADRMLDMGFIPDIRTVLKNIPAQRQTLMFSATMPEEIQRLAREILKEPKLIQIAPQGTTASGVRQVVYSVDSGRKRDLLIHLMEKEKMDQVLVFTRTKHRADHLTEQLQKKGKRAAALHSNKSQSARTQTLESFRRGKIQVLVATNIASRGLDVKGVSHVVNYEFPESPEDYIHRIGRTGRAEATGDAISLMSPPERENLRDIERLLGKKIPVGIVDGFEVSRETAPEPAAKRSFRSRPSGHSSSRHSARDSNGRDGWRRSAYSR